MTLMKKLRNGVLATGLALAVAGFGGCRNDNPGDRVNQFPKAQIGTDFGNGYDGNVNYLLTGTDADGTISHVYAKFNNGIWGLYANGQAVSVPIVQGTNEADIYVVDDFGAPSPIVSKSFTPATEAEARARIYSRLSATSNGGINGGYTGPNQTQYGLSDVFADFIVERLPQGDSVVVEYIGENDNLAQEMNDKTYFDTRIPKVPNLYMAGLPPSEIDSRLNKFIDDNWQ